MTNYNIIVKEVTVFFLRYGESCLLVYWDENEFIAAANTQIEGFPTGKVIATITEKENELKLLYWPENKIGQQYI